MSTRRNGLSRDQKVKNLQGEGANWILIVGGALFSTLSIRLGFKLKQALDSKQQANASKPSKANRTSDMRRSPACSLHSNMYSFTATDDCCIKCMSGGTEGTEITHPSNTQMVSESDVNLPLVKVAASEFQKDNGVLWASSPDRLELPPPKPFHHSACSDSPCVSESGSDVFSKREVIQKLRQQLKRRDEMILEMQDQILELQNSINSQVAHSNHLQAQLDATNRDRFDSEREIQRLKKAISDHCMGHKAANGHVNGYLDGVSNYESSENGRGDDERIEMLRREVRELKEVIEGKEFLLQSYREQKSELSMKVKELQQRLDSQLPNIL